jgi:hypothetical protein
MLTRGKSAGNKTIKVLKLQDNLVISDSCGQVWVILLLDHQEMDGEMGNFVRLLTIEI